MSTELEQQPDEIRSRTIYRVGLAVIAVVAALVLAAWMLVRPPAEPIRAPAQASPLEHGLFEGARGGAERIEAGQERLERYEWVDRTAGVVHIPIARAIDAVVADPSLIGPSSAPVARGAP